MTFKKWESNPAERTVVCTHAKASKYVVDNMLTPGKEYAVKNETEEFIFVVDNSGKVGGYYKTYFE